MTNWKTQKYATNWKSDELEMLVHSVTHLSCHDGCDRKKHATNWATMLYKLGQDDVCCFFYHHLKRSSSTNNGRTLPERTQNPELNTFTHHGRTRTTRTEHSFQARTTEVPPPPGIPYLVVVLERATSIQELSKVHCLFEIANCIFVCIDCERDLTIEVR